MKSRKNRLFSITITKKILFIVFVSSLLSILLTTVFSYIVFQKLIDEQMSVVDLKTSVIKTRFEELYKSNIFELPKLNEEIIKRNKNSNFIIDNIEKEFPDYKFEIDFVEGRLKYNEIPKLLYDNREKKYFFEITREINFEQNLPFRSLQLSIKFSFFSIIFKSLVFGVFLTTIILIPVMIFFSKKIVNPIISISKGAKKIANGALGIQVNYKSNDEVGELSDSFNYMSRELSKIKKIRDDLLATVSHELRSPLGRINGYTEMLIDLDFSNEERERYYKSILQETELLNSMAGEIIEISRLELNKEHMFFEEIDINYIIHLIIEYFSVTLHMKSIDIKFTYQDNLYGNFDFDKMRRVFINVIQNSINAGAKCIKISSYIENDIIKVEINDDGRGIPKDKLEIVFEKFYRVDKSRDRNTGGFGLGLAISRGIVAGHKGKIYFLPCNIGSKLVFEFPSV